MKNLGSKLKELRKMERLTTKELADKLQLSQPYISQIESGGRVPHPKNIQKIADFFNVPYGYLMTDEAINLNEFKKVEGIIIDRGKEKYIPYYLVVDKAIDEEITPDELEDAINFVRKYKNKTPST